VNVKILITSRRRATYLQVQVVQHRGTASLKPLVMSANLNMSDPTSFVAVSFVSCLTGIPPASGPNLAAGLYHGILQGAALFLLAAVLAAVVSLLLVRAFLRDFVLRKMVAYEGQRIALDGAIKKEGAFTIVMLLRLSPVMPLAPANLLLALTSVDVLPYIAGTFVGLTPFSTVYAYIGSVGQQAADGGADSTQMAMQIVGLVATILLTWKITKVAQKALASAKGE
jgi:uncharacterized membrane protein YdjX (TVP38/TMEM64 family)